MMDCKGGIIGKRYVEREGGKGEREGKEIMGQLRDLQMSVCVCACVCMGGRRVDGSR